MSVALNIAVIGTGISGLSAAWLLSQRHRVTVYEAADRLGGHSHTVTLPNTAPPVAVDTGFIVYNESTYPNLTALFRHLEVPTADSDMSFAVSVDGGRLEYSGTDLNGLFAQRRNLVNLRFWAMLRDLVRFYRDAPSHAGKLGLTTLGRFLEEQRYGRAFRDDHLLPMAAAIWSAPAHVLLDYPAEAFIRFCDNHGLLRVTKRPIWRTVQGGSQVYVERLAAAFADRIRLGCPIRAIERGPDDVCVTDATGTRSRYDAVVIAAHANQALTMLADPSPDETALLGAFQYSSNQAVLHRDEALMPKRRRVWSSWNYIGRDNADGGSKADLSVTYWLNRLQPLACEAPLFLTLNPRKTPRPETVLHTQTYEHPMFDANALRAQERLWSLQGGRRTWFCGAYFGAGFHEDGLQAGLAVAEQLGRVRRPWTVGNESGRIRLGAAPSGQIGLAA